MNTKPLVTVIIPCFNSDLFIQDCLESVLQQTYENIEIILVDDGSTDESLSKIEKYSTRITILKKVNGGAASARNLGIRNSNGSYIAFLDSDDVWYPEKIAKQMKLMTAKQLDLVYCGGESVGDIDLSIKYTPEFSGDCYSKFLEFPTRAIVILGCSSAIIRKSILEYSGDFDTQFLGAAEDWDFFRRFCKFGKVGFVNESLVKYRLHDKNVSTRGVKDFYQGNYHAIIKMFTDDKTIGVLQRANILAKFEVIIIKYCFMKFVVDKIRSLLNEISERETGKWSRS